MLGKSMMPTLRILLVLMVIVLPCLAIKRHRCRHGRFFKGSCYLIPQNKTTYFDAIKLCRQEGAGTLASAKDKATDRFLQGLVKGKQLEGVWFGLSGFSTGVDETPSQCPLDAFGDNRKTDSNIVDCYRKRFRWQSLLPARSIYVYGQDYDNWRRGSPNRLEHKCGFLTTSDWLGLDCLKTKNVVCQASLLLSAETAVGAMEAGEQTKPTDDHDWFSNKQTFYGSFPTLAVSGTVFLVAVIASVVAGTMLRRHLRKHQTTTEDKMEVFTNTPPQ